MIDADMVVWCYRSRIVWWMLDSSVIVSSALPSIEIRESLAPAIRQDPSRNGPALAHTRNGAVRVALSTPQIKNIAVNEMNGRRCENTYITR